jgi:MYXO-CTERM domain-containing protein
VTLALERPGRRLIAGLVLGMAIATAVPLTSRVLKASEGGSIEMLISWDLTGISYFSGRDYRAGMEAPVAIARLDCYSPRLFDSCRMVTFATRAEALRRWRAAVAEQPLAYVKHRALVFSMLLRAGCDNCRPYVWVGHSDANPYGFEFQSHGMHQVLKWITVGMANPPSGRPHVWLVAALGLTALAWRRRRMQGTAPTLICASGVVYALTYAAVALTDEFRYLYWLFFSVILGISAILFGSTDRGRFRALALWVLVPMLLASLGERTYRHHWPTDHVAPSMKTNY